MTKKTDDEVRSELDNIIASLLSDKKRNKMTDKNIIANHTMTSNPNWIKGYKIAQEKIKQRKETDIDFKQEVSAKASRASRKLWDDEQKREEMISKFQDRSKQESWLNNIKEAAERRANDPRWRQANKKAMEERSKKGTWKDNIIKRNKEMAQDPDWIKAHQQSRLKVVKPVITPLGIFKSLKDAAEVYDLTPEAIGYRIKKQHEGYCYISKEEYIEITGTNPFDSK